MIGVKDLVDLHLHTDASDGSCSPAGLLEILREAGCTVFAVTDHDTVAGAAEMADLVPEGMRFIPGCEFSCLCGERECHILGLGLDTGNGEVLRVIAHGQELRRAMNLKRIAFLKERFGVELTAEETASLGDLRNANKPGFARVLVARGLAPNIGEAIQTYLKPFKTKSRIDAGEAVRAVLACGGVPVWAHPLGGEGDPLLSPEEFRKQLAQLKELGIRGLECWYSRYGEAEVSFLLKEAEENGLLVSGGSDFHGDTKPDLPVGKLNSFGREVTEADLTVLACL